MSRSGIAETMALFLIRYGEIGLKSKPVRRRFEKALRDNVVARFIELGKECRIKSDWGRIYIWSDDVATTERILKRTFGVVSFSVAEECPAEKEDIGKLAVEVARPLFKKGMSFRIKARRMGEHKFTSMELGKDIGSVVWMANEHLDPSVDLKNPDLTIFIEVRQNRAFVFSRVVKGPGGMPVGTQGRVLALIDEEKDVAAAWLMMKRGCRVFLSAESEEKVSALKAWDPRFRVVDKVGIEDAEELARKMKAEGVVLGWSVDEFDRHTALISDMYLTVFYPLIGMDETQISGLMNKIT